MRAVVPSWGRPASINGSGDGARERGLDVAKYRPHDIDDVVRQVDEVTGALKTLADVLDQEENLSVGLHRVCRQALHAIGDADLASVTLLREGRLHTAASSHDHAREIDEAQYAAEQGTCVHTAKSGQVERATVVDLRDRWPDLAAELGDAAVGSYLSAPLFIDDEHHGSLNLYAHDSHGFDALEAALLELYVTAAEATLHNAHRYMRAREQVAHLG